MPVIRHEVSPELDTASDLHAQISPPPRQRPPTSDPSTTTTQIELLELPLSPERGRTLSSTSSVISNTLGPSILTHPPPPLHPNGTSSSATESDRSVTPPSTASLSSTPTTSLHPSFSSHDRERPPSHGERTGNDEPVERTLTQSPSRGEENNTNRRLTPIPQGEVSPRPAQLTTQAPASPATTSRALIPRASLPTLRRSISHKSPLQTSIALAALIVTFIATVYYGHRADKMNLFMMLGAYRQDCWSQKGAGHLSPECEVELGKGLARPPYHYAYRRMKRGVEVVEDCLRSLGGRKIAEDSHTGTGTAFSDYLRQSLMILIPLLATALLLLTLFHRRRTYYLRHPQQGADLVRNVPPFMILKEPKSGQHIGLTQRRTKDTPTKSITFSSRKKSLQDHFDDLHNHPEWKQHLGYIATDEDEHSGELPGERIARITRKIANVDADTDTETGSFVEGDSASVISRFKRNIREKLHRADTADSNLSALGSVEAVEPATHKANAHPKDNANANSKFNTKSSLEPDSDSDTVPGYNYNFCIEKGMTSMGLVSIGTTLGASAGGEIGQEMLVKGVDASELGDAKGDLMVPGEPQDVSLVLTGG